MENFNIITIGSGRFLKLGYSPMYLLQNHIMLEDITTENESQALVMNRNQAEEYLTELNREFVGAFRIIPAEENKQNKFQDLNGLQSMKMKVITEIIQEIDPVKFSQACEDLISSVNPDTLISYNTQSGIVRVQLGEVIMFTAILQYWGTMDLYEEWLSKIKSKNSLIMF